MMKKNILVAAIFSLILFSCDNASGGNKNIIPTDPSAQSETSKTKPHAEHNNTTTDSAKTTTTKEAITTTTDSNNSEKAETEKAEKK